MKLNMKRLILLLAVMALLYPGCQKPELVGHDAENLSFEAIVEEFDTQTRTSLTSGNYVVWSSEDRVAIFQGSAIADEYKLKEGCEGLSGGSFRWVAKDNVVNDDFNVETELPCNVAFYPYSQGLLLVGDMEEGGRTIFAITNLVLPQVQTYAQNSFGNGAFPMVAVTANMADHNLKFKNVGGAMKFQFKGTQIVKSIKVVGLNGEKLSGAATVTVYAGKPTLSITMTGTDEASKSVTLDCGDGVQLSKTKATDFIIALPPVFFSKGFTVTVTDVEEKEYTTSATIANTVLRSSILVMPEVLISSSSLIDYIDEYGINHGKGIAIGTAVGMTVWAPVNCGYHATDYQWGKLYQWGRKYGQGYDGDAVTPELSEGGLSLQDGQSEKNKNVFFTCEYSPYDWLSPSDDQLWNSGTEESPVKTEYDPCPEGWRVPTSAELNELSQHRSSWTTNDAGQSGCWFSGASHCTESAAKVFFPAAGYRYDSGDNAFYRGDNGYYWSSSSYPNCDLARSLAFFDHALNMLPSYRAFGHSVRCVQD